MTHRLEPLFRPRSIAFIGGSNLIPSLRYQRDLGYAGQIWVVSPKYDMLEGYTCVPAVEDLPEAPDLAFVAIRREAAVEAVAALRDKGCRAVVCNAAGFAEAGPEGERLQAKLLRAAGKMPVLGPNVAGLVNFVDPMATMMHNLGVERVQRGFAVVSQGGTLLYDAAASDRGLAITHLVSGGNQAMIGVEECVDYLLDDPRVSAVGLSFESLRDVGTFRRAAAKALRLGKPIVAIKFGKSEAGAKAAASHTASMTGSGAAWDALFDRLGIISATSASEFFETLKLIDSGQTPKGRRVLVTSASGVMSVMLADHLSAAGFELPQPTGERLARLRETLPALATPGNPQDVTTAVWNDEEQQRAIYSAILDEGYDVAMMIQNYPRADMEHVDEYAAQVDALGEAVRGRDLAAIQLAPLVDCFPASAREHTRSLGLAAMQGLEECIKALLHAVWWRERRAQLVNAGPDRLAEVFPSPPTPGDLHDEAAAKAVLAAAGVAVPESRVTDPETAHEAAAEIGFPVVVKALDERLLHKTEVGAVRIGLSSSESVQDAVETMRADMRRLAPTIPLTSVLVEAMAVDVVVEMMASVTHHSSVGPAMMIAGGGVEAELWNDSTLLAAPFTRDEIARAIDQLKVAELLKGWRGRPAGNREALVNMLEALGRFVLAEGVEEVEINPILVGREQVLAVDAVLKRTSREQSSPSAA